MQETRMPLTRDFRETVKARAERDPAFRAGLLEEALQAVVDGDLPTARVLLRDAINATTGFKQLGQLLGIGEKSLMRMFGPKGNPRADNLLATLAHLRAAAHVSIQVKASPAPERKPNRARAPAAA
jgi:DNA-binding phage protein